MTYEYNYTEEVVKRVYVYKDDPAFIYCYGETNSVYANEVTNPNTSNFTVETVKFRIYPETGKASNENYTVEHTIEYEGKPEKTLTTSDYYESNCNFSLQFPNVYSKTDFSDTDLFKKVTITFRIGTVIYTYYVYIR
jgi:hypothetical protein